MMIIDPKKEFSLNAPFFDQMRSDLDAYITRAPKVMEAKNTEACSITLKIDIAYENVTVKDENAPTGERESMVPNVSYKLSLGMQVKAERKGDVVKTGHELVQDDSGKYFILSQEEASGQLSMFNAWDELAKDGQGIDEDETEESDDE